MSTTLLLEGDDLEALLARARAEGGPHARIVRAEKVRSGGVLGFFARERFEVALEVPDRGVDLRSSRLALPADTAPASRKGTTMSEGTPDRVPGAVDRLTRRLVAAADDPAVAAAEGLLGLTERADAEERARTWPSSTARSDDPSDALDQALRRLLAQGEPEPVPAAPVRPSTTRPEFTALLDQLRSTAGGTGAAPVTPSAPVLTAPAPPAPAPVPTSVATPAVVAAAYEIPEAPVAPVAMIPTQRTAPVVPIVERQTLGHARRDGSSTTRDRREDPQLAADRRALRALGVPVAWTRQLRPGDRFTAVLRMLDRMPDVDIDPATRVVAVVGPSASVQLEAHRTALDLATGSTPRPVVTVPARPGAERATALTEARFLGDVVVAVETDGEAGAAAAVEALQAVDAGAVIVIVSAADPIERSQTLLDALGQIDGLAVEGTGATDQPAGVLQLGLPIVRLDGIPVDRYTWTAVLCAQLVPVTAP